MTTLITWVPYRWGLYKDMAQPKTDGSEDILIHLMTGGVAQSESTFIGELMTILCEEQLHQRLYVSGFKKM